MSSMNYSMLHISGFWENMLAANFIKKKDSLKQCNITHTHPQMDDESFFELGG